MLNVVYKFESFWTLAGTHAHDGTELQSVVERLCVAHVTRTCDINKEENISGQRSGKHAFKCNEEDGDLTAENSSLRRKFELLSKTKGKG